eukprot:CAMPEP_0173165834 /NCGR_PEP_ID=MMETSP1105-20130129/21632_1 /TAXON_ID=2985 /ORGANISM="Ochromonas sp., Strain BG-1" /LENGTH=371 /DNA_ID=CAMNT_0014086917 /DNA_START=325 /DNA_END=1441 /DNA_ORIENTATION=-
MSEFLAIHSSLLPDSDSNYGYSIERLKEVFAERKEPQQNDTDPEKKEKNVKSSSTLAIKKKEQLPESEEERNERVIAQIRDILVKFRDGELKGGKLVQKKDSTILFNHLLVTSNPKSAASSSLFVPLQFPSSLSSFLRLKVHELATDFVLYHESSGEGKQRFVSVSKFPFNEKEEKKKEEFDVVEEKMKTETLADHSEQMGDRQLEKDEKNDGEEEEDEYEEEKNEEAEEINNSKKSENSKAGGSKKKAKKKSKSKGKTVGTGTTTNTDPNTISQQLIDSLDEDTFLAMQIEQNRRLAELHQYRIGSRPMPNYEKEYAKDKLKSKLAEKQDSRKVKIEPKATSGTSNSGSNNKKVLKKPVPNFGGGKVGTK